MGIAKESLNVDFVVENRPLTKDEENQISEYIIAQKKKQGLKEKVIRTTSKTKQKI